MAFSVYTIGSEDHVSTTTAFSQNSASAATLSDGRRIVTWASNDAGAIGDIYQQSYAADGTAIGTESLVNTTLAGSQLMPKVAALAGGGWVVVWQSLGQDGDGFGIYAQAFDKNGAPIGGETQVNQVTAGSQLDPVVTGLSGGGFAVAWASADQDGPGFAVVQRAYTDQGVAVGSEFIANTFTLGDQTHPAIAALANDRWVLTWDTGSPASPDAPEIVQRVFDAGGALGGEAAVNGTLLGSQSRPTVAVLANGGWVVVWHSFFQDGDQGGIYQQVYDADGDPVGDETRVNVTTAGNQYAPAVAAFADGSWTVTWASDLGGGQKGDIYQRHYGASGATGGPDLRVNATLVEDQIAPAIVADAGGGWHVVWQSFGQDGSGYGIYQRSFVPTGGSALTAGDDLAIGTDAADTLVVAAGTFGAGDQIVGGGGADTLAFSGGGTIDVSSGAVISGIETLAGSAGDDVILTTGPTLALFSTIEGGDGDDTIEHTGLGDFSNLSLVGIDHILLKSSDIAVSMDDYDMALLLDGSQGTNQQLVFLGGALSTVQRAEIFSRGIESIAIGASTYVDAAPTGIGLDAPVASIAEGTVVGGGIKIADIVVTDDGEGKNVLSLAGADVAAFELRNGTELWFVSQDTLDFLLKPSYDVVVQVDDPGVGSSPDKSVAVSLAVEQVDEPPSLAFAPSGAVLFEGSAPGLVLGTFSGSDPEGLATTFSIPDPNSPFAIDAGNHLVVVDGSAFNYETATNATVTVRASDPGGLFRETTFSFPVGNVNEQPSLVFTPSGAQLLEGSVAGLVLGSFTAADPDGPAPNLAILDPNSPFAIDAANQLVVANGAVLDYETAKNVSVTVRASDPGGLFDDEAVTFAVANVNEQPTALSLSGSTVKELAPKNTVIGVLSTTDADLGDTFTYALASNPGGRFAIQGNALVVANGVVLDFEQARSRTHKLSSGFGRAMIQAPWEELA